MLHVFKRVGRRICSHVCLDIHFENSLAGNRPLHCVYVRSLCMHGGSGGSGRGTAASGQLEKGAASSATWTSVPGKGGYGVLILLAPGTWLLSIGKF